MATNSHDDSKGNPYTKHGVVTADEEVWIQDRIRTAIRMAMAAKSERRVGADKRQAEDAIDGIVNGTAVEIINHLGLETEGANLRLRDDRDSHLQADANDDLPHPWNADVPCPTDDCPQPLKVRWPPDNPDSVTVRCHRCGEETTVRREDSDELDG